MAIILTKKILIFRRGREEKSMSFAGLRDERMGKELRTGRVFLTSNA